MIHTRMADGSLLFGLASGTAAMLNILGVILDMFVAIAGIAASVAAAIYYWREIKRGDRK